MKAMVYTKAGYLDVLKVNDIPKPTPKDNQVLVAVKAGALSITDYERFKSLSDKVPLSTRITNTLLGFNDTPIGAEIAGIVVAVGKNITHVKVGDSVFGKTAGFFPKGGFAEYALMDKDRVYQKPDNLTFEQASAISISFETALGAGKNKGRSGGYDLRFFRWCWSIYGTVSKGIGSKSNRRLQYKKY
jgi:NADPH:quinone reductase-like Zn-dependent oxidoreductase